MRSIASSWLIAALVVTLVTLPGHAFELVSYPDPGPPRRITKGPDGNVWFTRDLPTLGKITPAGTVSTYSISTPASDITAGPDGNLWFVGSGVIGRITPAGTVTEFPVAYSPERIAAGPGDGHMWFTIPTIGTARVGKVRVTPPNTITEYDVGGHPTGIVAGPDGNLWVSSFLFLTFPTEIKQVTTTGGVTTFAPAPAYVGAGAFDIVAGPDGNLWFPSGQNIGRITVGGSFTFFPYAANITLALTTVPDGNLWFSNDGNYIGLITTAGVFTFPVTQVPTAGSAGLASMTAGPDGNLWFTAPDDELIYRLLAHDSVLVPIRPLALSIRLGMSAATKGVRVKVRNADASGRPSHPIRLLASDGDCPAGTIGTPDFESSILGAQDTTSVAPGGSDTATVLVTATAGGFTALGMRSPGRCTAMLTAISQDPPLELSPDNNSAPLVIDVIDQNDF